MVKLVLRLFSILPLPLNHFIGSIVGLYLYTVPSKSKRVVRTNVKLCFPDLNENDIKRLVKNSLIEAGKGFTELGFIWFNDFNNNSKYIKNIVGIEHINSEQPAILLVPHFGCWEITGRVISLNRPVTFLYKPLKNEGLEGLVLSRRQIGDLQMATADKNGVIKLQRSLNNKELIGILPDQDPGQEGSLMAPFFSHDIRTMTLLVKLARKSNTRVLMTWAERLSHGSGYILNIKPVNVLSESNNLDDDVALMNKAIEDLVRTKPEQYLFNYKRFKSIVRY